MRIDGVEISLVSQKNFSERRAEVRRDAAGHLRADRLQTFVIPADPKVTSPPYSTASLVRPIAAKSSRATGGKGAIP